MIRAQHKKWARLLYEFYIYRLLRKNFSGMHETNDMPEIPGNRALMVTPNHISWWDGFFIDKLLTEKIDKKIHLMMLERELKKFRFFSKNGAFSINQDNAASVKESARYTRSILSTPSNFCVIYPQGEIEAFEKPQLTIKKGISLFAKDTGCAILPVAIKIQHENKKHPSVYVRYGKLLNSENVIDDFTIFINEFTQTRNLLNEHLFEKKEFGENLL